MEASFDEQVHEAIVSCIGEAALKVLVQGRELTADTVQTLSERLQATSLT